MCIIKYSRIRFVRYGTVEALLVSCLACARLGFAQQPVLVQLYRSLYARLPALTYNMIYSNII